MSKLLSDWVADQLDLSDAQALAAVILDHEDVIIDQLVKVLPRAREDTLKKIVETVALTWARIEIQELNAWLGP